MDTENHRSPGQHSFFSLEGPLDVSPSGGQVRAANLGGLAFMARQHGIDARSIVERHGLDPLVLVDPESLIAPQHVAAIFEECAALFDDPLFGLRIGLLQEPEVYGCVTALCRAAPTVRAGIRGLIDYLPVVHAPDCDVVLMEGEDLAELVWLVNTDLGVNDQANFQAAVLNLKLLQAMGGPGFRPTRVSLSADVAPAHVAEVERLLGCRVVLRANHNAVAFPVQVLNQPVPGSNRLLFRLLGGYLEHVKATQSPSIVERVESCIRGSLASGHCTIEHCADKLGFSVRTLQARLAAEQVRFSALLEAQRERIARNLLTGTQMSLDEVAEQLGYGEQTSFGRAFKRWTGQTPQQFRAGASQSV